MTNDAPPQVFGVSEGAAAKAVALAAREGHAEALLRVRVLAGGCSGFTYKLSFEAAPDPDDRVVDAPGGLRVLIDPKSEPIVAGSTLEFNDAMLGGGFKVHNPRAVHECACGDSFSI
jgi:iron-sulfur cluster assembly accessory protein